LKCNHFLSNISLFRGANYWRLQLMNNKGNTLGTYSLWRWSYCVLRNTEFSGYSVTNGILQ